MPQRHHIRPILTGWPELTAELKKWKETIEQALSITFGVGFHVRDGKHGKTVSLVLPPGALPAVSTTTIPKKPSAGKLGKGSAKLSHGAGDDLTDGPTVTVYNNFLVDVPTGRNLVVVPFRDGYLMVGADCPP